MTRIAFLDCRFGAAGDMLLAACLDAGADQDALLAGLGSITELQGEWGLAVGRVVRSRGHIAATHVKVSSVYGHEAVPVGVGGGAEEAATSSSTHGEGEGDGEGEGCDGGHGHSHSHDHSHGHDHGHGHDHSHHHHHHSHDSHDHSHHSHHHDHSHHHHHHGHDHSHHSHDHHGHSHDSHDHGHDHHHHGHHHHGPHRGLKEITAMIEGAEGLPPRVKAQSVAVFTALAAAEAATHGVEVEEIHFHEVGAVDSIIDTVGTVLALHLLGVERVYASALPFGEGITGLTAHGHLPVPTPATLRLLLGVPTVPGPKGATGELVTPTGAALVKVLAGGRHGQPPPFVPEAIGVGAGTKDFPGHANVVRVVVGTLHDAHATHAATSSSSSSSSSALLPLPALRALPSSTPHTRRPTTAAGLLPPAHEPDELQRAPPTLTTTTTNPQPLPAAIPPPAEASSSHPSQSSAWSSEGGWEERHLCKLEANLDDMTPETASFALERLLAEPGCLDVWYAPAVMKKGRPGLTLHLLCEPAAAPALLRRMFLETPTLGVRAHTVARLALERDFVVVPTRYGEVRAKVGRMDGVVVNVKPEYEDCRGAAMALGLPLRAVVEEAARAARAQTQQGGGAEGAKGDGKDGDGGKGEA